MDSRVDQVDTVEAPRTDIVQQFVCSACGQKFSNYKALSLHASKLHGRRNELRLYLDGDGKCPARNGVFHSRLRALAHLTDRRNISCKEVVASGILPRISDEKAADFAELDRVAIAVARKEGRSHPIAEKSARTAGGKHVGYVTK